MTELPRKAVARTARLAALPLGFAGRNAIGLGKRLGGKPAEAVMAEVQQRTAEQLFRTLGELKGGAMKFGQALSVLESALPEEVAGPYREHLTRLQDSAPPMPTQTVRDILERDLGPDWKDRLVWLDGGPTAAASIGQVHKGRWHDGRDVAVKVQYPGAGEALMSDLKQLARLARTIGPLVPGVDIKPLIEEMQARAVEELDYQLEADAQSRFADVFRDDPRDRRARGGRARRHRAGDRVGGEPVLAGAGDPGGHARRSATTTASCSCGSCSPGRSAPACCTPTRTRGTSGCCPAPTAGSAGSRSSTTARSPGSPSAASPRRWAG